MTFKELIAKYTFEDIKDELVALWRRNKPGEPDEQTLQEWRFVFGKRSNALLLGVSTGHILIKSSWKTEAQHVDMNFVVFDKNGRLQGPVAAYSLGEIPNIPIYIAEGVSLTEIELTAGLIWECTYYTQSERINLNRQLFLRRKGVEDLSEEELVYVQQQGYYAEDMDSLYNIDCDRLMSFDFEKYFPQRHIAAQTGTQLFEKQKRLGIVTICYRDSRFPTALEKIGRTPLFIHLKGNRELLGKRGVAIVGARKADEAGCRAAYRLARKYAEQGYVIISGLALGCDSAAHRGCLDAGGETIAIVASGLDIVHPKENASLQQEILDKGGLVLSEQWVGTKANPTRLVSRTRLQAALAEQLIVAQCPVVSGTMYAVQFARELDKPIYAVQYDNYTDLSSGNEYIIGNKIGMPIKWEYLT